MAHNTKLNASRITAMRWSEDGKTLLSRSEADICICDYDGAGKLSVRKTIQDDGGAFSPNGKLVACRGDSAVRLRQLDDGRVLRTIVMLSDKRQVVISPDGHHSSSPDVENELVYVALTDDGQETLTPEQFGKRNGWKNNPEKLASE